MGQASFASRWVLPGLVIAVAAVFGCSVSDLTEGVFSDGSNPSGTGGSGTTTTTSTAGETSTTTTTTTTTGPGGGEGGAGGAGGGGTTTTTTTTTTSTGGGTLDCGNETCPQEQDSACCWNAFQNDGGCIMGPPDQDTCNTGTSQDGFSTRIECQVPSHCPDGQICCGNRVQLQNGTYYTDVNCQVQCDLPDIVLCDPAAPVCPPQLPNCGPSQLLPDGYFVCRQN